MLVQLQYKWWRCCDVCVLLGLKYFLTMLDGQVFWLVLCLLLPEAHFLSIFFIPELVTGTCLLKKYQNTMRNCWNYPQEYWLNAFRYKVVIWRKPRKCFDIIYNSFSPLNRHDNKIFFPQTLYCPSSSFTTVPLKGEKKERKKPLLGTVRWNC